VEELLAALDASIPVRSGRLRSRFLMPVEDVFSIPAGTWRRGGSAGKVKVGRKWRWWGLGRTRRWW